MEDLFDTLTIPTDVAFDTPSVAVERRSSPRWASVCTLTGIALLLGSGAFFLTLGFSGIVP